MGYSPWSCGLAVRELNSISTIIPLPMGSDNGIGPRTGSAGVFQIRLQFYTVRLTLVVWAAIVFMASRFAVVIQSGDGEASFQVEHPAILTLKQYGSV